MNDGAVQIEMFRDGFSQNGNIPPIAA